MPSFRVVAPPLSQWLRDAAAWVLGWYLRAALGTTRWQFETGAAAPLLQDGPVIVAVWHERLALMPPLVRHVRQSRPGRSTYALASRSRDGRLIGAILARFGVITVHGSSANPDKRRARGGAAGMLALHGALEAGHAAVITPDGPRGPRRTAAPGVAQLAALSGAAVVAAAAQVRWRITLNSWDAMVLPLPFGTGCIVCGPPLHVDRDAIAAGLADITHALNQAAARADALCRP